MYEFFLTTFSNKRKDTLKGMSFPNCWELSLCHDPKNWCDDTDLVPPIKVSLKLYHYNKMRKLNTPKIWLRYNWIKRKIQGTYYIVSELEKIINMIKKVWWDEKQLPHKSTRSLGKKENILQRKGLVTN